MEPLCYPLVFPYGVDKWDAGKRTQVRFNDYKMLALATDDNGIPLTAMKNAGTRLTPLKRLQLQS